MFDSFFRKSLDRIYLFLHIPKCAGSTLLSSLATLGKKRHIVVDESPESKAAARDFLDDWMQRNSIDSERLDVIAGHDVFFEMHNVSARPACYFTVLRDPVARYISHYKHMVDSACVRTVVKNNYGRDIILENGRPISIAQFADRQIMTNVMTNYLAAAAHPDLTTKRWYVADPDELLALAMSAIKQMNWIGFVEDFPEDLRIICSMLQLKPASATNQSVTQVADDLPVEVMEKIRYNNSLDQKIYDFAKRLRDG